MNKYLRTGMPSPFLRARVEQALGWQPIYSSSSVVEVRRLCFERFGYDPAQLTLAELRAIATERRVTFTQRLPHAELLSTFIAHFAVRKPKTS